MKMTKAFESTFLVSEFSFSKARCLNQRTSLSGEAQGKNTVKMELDHLTNWNLGLILLFHQDFPERKEETPPIFIQTSWPGVFNQKNFITLRKLLGQLEFGYKKLCRLAAWDNVCFFGRMC